MTLDEAFRLVAIAVEGISARAIQRFEADLIALGVGDDDITRLLEQSLEATQDACGIELRRIRKDVEAWLRRDGQELQ